MLVIVTLVKDTQANVDRFLELNFRNGADGIVLFLDAGSDAVSVPAQYQPYTLVRRLDAEWWDHDVPPLNGRQRVVANMVRVACSRVTEVEWLFFLDGDEVALLDRSLLAAIPSDLLGVRLAPLETVSAPDMGRPLFKRPLSHEELRRLTEAGLIARPTNAAYFHGHLAGKVGIRPSQDVRFWVHTAVDREGEKLTMFEHPDLRHLHFESPDFHDFVRKWQTLATSGHPPGLRGRRKKILEAFRDMQAEPPSVQDSLQRSLYDRFVREDGHALRAAGVLESVDLSEVRWEPRPSAKVTMQAVDAELVKLAGLPRRSFLPRAADA